jgi:hypothetical protein
MAIFYAVFENEDSGLSNCPDKLASMHRRLNMDACYFEFYMVNTHHVRFKTSPQGRWVKLLSPEGEKIFLTPKKANWNQSPESHAAAWKKELPIRENLLAAHKLRVSTAKARLEAAK